MAYISKINTPRLFLPTPKQKQNKFGKDLRWNILGFILVALCGLSINILITHYFSFAILGYFNLLLVFFLVLSQISSWGIQLSVQKFIPQFHKNKLLCKQIFTSSLLISIVFAIVAVGVLFLMREIPGRIMSIEFLELGFVYIIPGIGFITINKIFLSFLNGMRFMKTYAFFSASRPFLMLIVVLVIVAANFDVKFLGLIFTIPELLLLGILSFSLKKWFTILTITRLKNLSRLLFRYGNRVVLGSVVTNFQSKIDIFVLGFFVSSTMLGVYSFAVFVADGFFQIFYVFRTNMNPVITNIFYNRSSAVLKRVIRKSIKSFFKFFVSLGLFLAFLYPGLLWLFNIDDYFFTNLSVFYILLTGILIASGYVPFQFYYNQTGRPKEQTGFLILLFCFTLTTNLFFVPFIGIYGAAVGIFLSNIFQMLYLQKSFKKIII